VLVRQTLERSVQIVGRDDCLYIKLDAERIGCSV
jgi:hypothetical protein